MKLLSLIISALLLLSISGERVVKGVQRAKIIGGQPAPVGRYRFQAGLKFSAGATFPGCGGTLIAPNIVLSAGHCSGAVRVTVGCHTLTNATGEPTCETFSIAQEIVHPNFFEDSRGVPHNDLMILKLSGTSVNPPIAYVANPGFDVPEGYDITTMGWGTTSSGSQSAVLLEVDVDTVTNAYCLQQYNELGSGLVDDSMICGERAGKDSCQGDSGGPLIARCDIFEEDILIGAVSWGRGCALPGFAGVYARISFLYSFVLEHVTAAGFSLASPPALSTFCTVNGTFAPTPPPTTAAPVVTPTLPPLPSGWMCSPSYYGSLDGCDCECGVPDPDCETQQDLLFNCPTTALGCSPEGICILDDDSSVPSTWTCLTSYYATHDGCDCECGAYDPDCDDVGTIVYNCVAGATCSLEGNCVIASQSPTFSPIASVVITTFPTLSPGDVTLTTFPTASPLVNIATDSPTKFPTTASPTVVLETQAPAEFEQPPLEIEIIYIFVGAALGALIAVAVVCLWFSCSGGSAATARPVKKMEAKEAKISGGVLVNGKGSPTL